MLTWLSACSYSLWVSSTLLSTRSFSSQLIHKGLLLHCDDGWRGRSSLPRITFGCLIWVLRSPRSGLWFGRPVASCTSSSSIRCLSALLWTFLVSILWDECLSKTLTCPRSLVNWRRHLTLSLQVRRNYSWWLIHDVPWTDLSPIRRGNELYGISLVPFQGRRAWDFSLVFNWVAMMSIEGARLRFSNRLCPDIIRL